MPGKGFGDDFFCDFHKGGDIFEIRCQSWRMTMFNKLFCSIDFQLHMHALYVNCLASRIIF